jgi:FixJ family two-component response regulator
MNPFTFLVMCVAGWMNRNQQEVIEYLQEEIRVRKELLAILIMSGYSGVLTAGKVRELGFQELLSKPCTARALAEAVHRALQQTATNQITK